MDNTKLTKRKEEGNTQQVESDSDAEAELPQNQGNGDLVVDNHNKCDNLMAKLKALNQAAEDIPTALVLSTLPFVTLIITPVHDSTEVRGSEVENLSEVPATADAISESLINYLTGKQVDTNLVVVETNTDLGVDSQFINKEKEAEQPVEPIVIINGAGIHQPLKLIGKMLQELDFGKNRSKKRHEHIWESNIIVSTPVSDPCLSEFSMKKKKTLKVKDKGMRELKGAGQGGGGVAPPAGAVASKGAPRGWGKAPISAKPTGVPGKQESGQKHNLFSALAAAAAQSAKAAKKRPSPHDDDLDYEKGQKRARDPNLKQ